jgi:aminobenzoyl-glutamate utilization protein B
VVKELVLNWISKNETKLIEISDKIWEYAELGLKEFKSSKLLIDEFLNHGFLVDQEVAGMPTAFVASYGSGKPVVGVMGEYDALPGLSQKAVPSKEPLRPGDPGHGCGHNIHGTSAMAAAIAVKMAIETGRIAGTIKFFGSPAEENFSGKVFMVKDGVFDGVDVIISHHPSAMNAVTLRSSLANNSVKFHFQGKASHAAGSPEEGRSALDAVEIMNIGINYLREHIVQDARIHYIIEKGGEQPNIVPAYARSWYLIRSPERDQLDEIYQRVLDIAKGSALIAGTEVKIEFIKGIYNKIPNGVICKLIVNNMREVGFPNYSEEDLEFAQEIAKSITPEQKLRQLQKSKRPGWERLVDKLIDDEVSDPWGDGETSHGSTDVSDVSWIVPTVEFNVACWVIGTPSHSWQSTAQSISRTAHKGLIFASKVMAASLIDLLTKPQIINAAREEHALRLRDRTYKSPIPSDLKPPLDIWDK